ncbi:hypothetical protein MGN70_000363 [Eutypa lata]|nr:hypothetical protein MGN70_000363 [Eutypa lata]
MHLRFLVGLWASSLFNTVLADTSKDSSFLFSNSLLERPEGAPLPFPAENLRYDVPILTTIAELDTLQDEYDNHTRIEEVNGQAIVVYHNDTRHIGTVEGEALKGLQSSCREADGLGGGVDGEYGRLVERTRCSREWCIIRSHCSRKSCTTCVVFWCV